MALLAFWFFCAPCSPPPFCCFNLRWKHNHALHTSISSCCEISFPAVTRADQCPTIPTARADSTRTEWMAHANDNKSGSSSNQNTVLHLFVVRSVSFLNAIESMSDCVRQRNLCGCVCYRKKGEMRQTWDSQKSIPYRASLWAEGRVREKTVCVNACDWMRRYIRDSCSDEFKASTLCSNMR